jgi:hypothetical protein
MGDLWMGLSALSLQHSANLLCFRIIADRRCLIAFIQKQPFLDGHWSVERRKKRWSNVDKRTNKVSEWHGVGF